MHGHNKMSYTKKDIQEKFNVSQATVENWIKTGTLPPPSNGKYSDKIFYSIVKKIESEKLKSRANRTYSKSSGTVYLGIKKKERKELLEKLVASFKESGISIDDAVRFLSVQILSCNGLCRKKTTDENPFKDFFIKNEDDDILGAFYQSVQSIGKKSKSGSFYTPPEILKNISIPEDAKVLDPCCGSGGILINSLSKKHDPEKIFAYDTDETALVICRTNLILFFNDEKISPHIEKHDLIFSYENENHSETESRKYDIIITNPPWGGKLSGEQKESILKLYPDLKTTETFSAALFSSIKKLDDQGFLYFFLPESILNVGTHRNIRKFLINCRRSIEIVPLGKAFEGVQSECILLKLSEKKSGKIQVRIKNGGSTKIDAATVQPPDYIIPYGASKTDARILKKIYSTPHVKLSGKTKFALGIVTGNNKKYIRLEAQKKDEPVFRGKDILPYKTKEPETFISFFLEKFQQTAPEDLYRSKKIIYRFISKKLVCAIDEGHLILNSANMIIPDGYPMEILVLLFNSPVYSFIYQKKFKSKKVLKKHIQDFPLPVLDEKLTEVFLDSYRKIIDGKITQEDADKAVCMYFGLSDKEYAYIKKAVQ